MTHVTDYTHNESTIVGPMTPSRFGSYLADTIKLWLSDNRNIEMDALKGLKYVDGDTEAAYDGSSVYVDVEWPENQKVAGWVPAILVTFGNTTAGNIGMTIPTDSPHFPGRQFTRQLEFDINIVVRTAAYMGTQCLSELLFMYLSTFARELQKDAGVSKFAVLQLTPPVLSQSPGDSKDVFSANIVCKAQSVFNVTVDTVGPTFRGITFR